MKPLRHRGALAGHTAALLFHLVAFKMIATGLAGIAAASVLDLSARERALLGAANVASIVLGVVVLAWPDDTVLALRWLVVAQPLLVGIMLLAAVVCTRGALGQDRPPRDRGELSA